MIGRRELLGMTALAGAGLTGSLSRIRAAETPGPSDAATGFAIAHTDEEWRARLSPVAYRVLRQQGTEAPFSSKLDFETRPGTYACAGCALPLFSSEAKYDSHTGWPSFWRSLPGAVARRGDRSFGMERMEVRCTSCGGHLGHVFTDGPPPTGLRFCMNGVALGFAAA